MHAVDIYILCMHAYLCMIKFYRLIVVETVLAGHAIEVSITKMLKNIVPVWPLKLDQQFVTQVSEKMMRKGS